ncbi:hypothetical protein [Megalodesulfovibrio paquesii]
MATLLPQSELLRRAIAHVSEAMEGSEGAGEGSAGAAHGPALRALVEDACVRFNLSPLDSEFLMGFFLKRPPAAQPDAQMNSGGGEPQAD